MDLSKVRLTRIPRNSGAMLHRYTHVHVTLHAQSGEQVDRVEVRLVHRVGRAAADRGHDSGHASRVATRRPSKRSGAGRDDASGGDGNA